MPPSRDFPAELRSRAERAYAAALRRTLTGESVFPLPFSFPIPPTSERITERQDALAAIKAAEKTSEATGGLTIRWETRDSRHHGVNRVPEALAFETAHDLAVFCGQTAKWAAAINACDTLVESFPHLGDERVSLALKFAEEPLTILRQAIGLAKYLAAHPFPGCFARELPLPLSTKFIEDYRALVRDLVSATCPDSFRKVPGDTSLETCLGLAKPLRLIRARFARGILPSGYPDNHVAFTAEAWSRFDFSEVAAVYVIENQITYLTFPLPPRSVVFWGEGRAVGDLAPILPVVRAKPLFYWGDLDAHGFEILADLRRIHSATRSFLMEAALLETFAEFVLRDAPETRTDPAGILENLTEPEGNLYRHLRAECLRLEQERIPPALISTALSLSARPPDSP